MPKTRIICTIGPASQSAEIMRRMIEAGTDIVRLNFSHANYEFHRSCYERVRAISREVGRIIGVLQDLPGPKIRIGRFKGRKFVKLQEGDEFTLSTLPCDGDEKIVEVDYPGLEKYLSAGDKIFLDDGKIELQVKRIEPSRICCEVIIGGDLYERRGVNVPGKTLPLPAITEQDVKDLNYGIQLGVDYVAVSFTREAGNILEVRKILKERNAEHISVIAKIEDRLGVENLDSILEVADGVMIARGDMGVCLRREEVPLIQRRMIRRCREAGRPVIVATQMLDSMVSNPHPTRAEVTDVAEAVMEGADALMLSNETAIGLYPVEVVNEMVRIVREVESSPEFERVLRARRVYPTRPNLFQALGLAIDQLSEVVGGKAIVCSTKTGKSAKVLSSYRPFLPIIAVTQSVRVARSLIPFWGVEGVVSEAGDDTFILGRLVEEKLLKKGDLTILTSDVGEEPLSATIRVIEVR